MKIQNLVVPAITTLVLGLGAAESTWAGGDAAAGAVKADTCLGCHAIDGYKNASPVYPVPKLGGQHAEYLVAALKAYKDQQRSHKTMHAQAISLSEQDMADIAAFFSAQK
ncbi:MAG: cytochrome c [Gammaproteobacteria bacterium]|jgi:cytochrome c553|nr:cytochrome c [Gammaproteobacteria bacterium]